MSPCEFAFEAIGTSWKISIEEELSPQRQTALLDKILQRIERFDRSFSRFREDSDVTRWSRAAGTYPLPEDAGPLFALYRAMYDATGGAFTPLIGQTMVDAGYDATYSLKPKETIATIHDAALAALKSPGVRKRIDELGYVAIGDQPDEFAAHIKAEIANQGRLLGRLGVKAE